MDNLSALWSTELGWLDDTQLETFNPLGYYAVDELWTGGPKLLALNTLLYSSKLKTSPGLFPTNVTKLPDDPNGQFSWIQSQLDDSRSRSQK